MYIQPSSEQVALRAELREYFNGLMTPERKEAVRGYESGKAYKEIIRQMGQDGWLTIGWPKEYGGKGWGAQESLIFFEETRIAGAPFPFVTVNTVGPALIAHGSEEHKQFFLPMVLHRIAKFAGGSSAAEKVCRGLGLTQRWGSPVIVEMNRKR